MCQGKCSGTCASLARELKSNGGDVTQFNKSDIPDCPGAKKIFEKFIGAQPGTNLATLNVPLTDTSQPE